MERIKERYSDGKNVMLRLSDQENSFSDHIYEIKMINANQPAGLLPMHIHEEDGRVIYDYNITGLRSLKDSEGDDVQVDYLYSLITAMAREAEILTEFMLDPGKLQLSPEAIFFKQWSGEVFFCYDPGKTESLKTSLQRLMEYFLKKLDPKDEEDILFMYGLYQRTRESMVTLTSLNEFFLENREKYLKIREAREEQSKTVQEKKENENTETIVENSIYEDLGLEKPQRTTAFAFLKKDKESITPPVPGAVNMSDRSRTPKTKRKAVEEAAIAKEPETVLDLDSFRDRSHVKETESQEIPEPEISSEDRVNPERRNRKRKRVQVMTPEEEADYYDETDSLTERQMLEPASGRTDLDPKAIFGKLRPYGFELAVGGVVLAGVILFIIT